MCCLCDYSFCLCLLLFWLLVVNVDDSWWQIQMEVYGQIVWFNVWGGDLVVNCYLVWVSEEVKCYYVIDLCIVFVVDVVDVVKCIQIEVQVGCCQGGLVDLLWINGENFCMFKQVNLLFIGWVELLFNWCYVDL